VFIGCSLATAVSSNSAIPVFWLLCHNIYDAGTYYCGLLIVGPERVAVAATLQTCITEVYGSNLCRDTGYSNFVLYFEFIVVYSLPLYVCVWGGGWICSNDS
jgi:hypothetical protein